MTRFGAYPLLVARPALLRDADNSLDGTGETQCRRCCRSPAADRHRPGGLARTRKVMDEFDVDRSGMRCARKVDGSGQRVVLEVIRGQ